MTQIREAKQESEVTTKPQEVLYCILHEDLFPVQLASCGMGHVMIDNDGAIDYCCFEGGYAFVPPASKLDDLPVDWASQPEQLSDEEREQAELEEQGMWLGGME